MGPGLWPLPQPQAPPAQRVRSPAQLCRLPPAKRGLRGRGQAKSDAVRFGLDLIDFPTVLATAPLARASSRWQSLLLQYGGDRFIAAPSIECRLPSVAQSSCAADAETRPTSIDMAMNLLRFIEIRIQLRSIHIAPHISRIHNPDRSRYRRADRRNRSD